MNRVERATAHELFFQIPIPFWKKNQDFAHKNPGELAAATNWRRPDLRVTSGYLKKNLLTVAIVPAVKQALDPAIHILQVISHFP